MEYSEEMENPAPGQRLSPRNTFSKQLSIVANDKKDDCPHKIRVKVKLDKSEAHSFPVENPPGQGGAGIFTPVEDSKGAISGQIAESHCRNVKISCYDVSSGDGKQESGGVGKPSPILELKLGSFGKEGKDFDVFIKPKRNDKDISIETPESPSSNSEYYDAEDHLNKFDKTDPGKEVSPCIDSLHETAFEATPMDTSELSSKQTQTEKELESSSAQTTTVEVTYPEKKLETTTQADQKCNASTSADENFVPSRKSIEIQTEITPNKNVSLQTDTEMVTGASQTETAALFSIERTYEASTQTEKVEVAEASTSTDSDIYIVDRTKVSDKNTDSDDLPNVPLMAATKENAESHHDLSINATDSCQKDYGHILSPITEHNEHKELAAEDGAAQDETQLCFGNFRKRLDLLLKADIPESYFRESGVSETDQEDTKSMKPPFSLKLTEEDYSSSAIRENVNDHSKVEVIKSLVSDFNQRGFCVAVRVQTPIKFEKADVFKVPVAIQHFLNAFTLPARKTHRVVINPIKISTEGSKFSDSEVESIKKDLISKPPPTEERRNEGQTLGILGVTRGKSVIVSNIPNTMATDDKNSQVCLCDNCYDMIQNVVERKRQHFQKKSPSKLDNKLKENVKAKRSTTPRVRPKDFDYSVRDAWVPKECSEEMMYREEKVEATDIIHIDEDSDSDSYYSTESSVDMNLHSACEIVNNHLLNLRPVDEETVKKAAQTLHKAWFEIVASKRTDLKAVKYYIRYFEEFSSNLLKTLLHSADSKGNNVLHFAFANNRFDLVEELLSNGYAVDLLKKANQTGNSPLMVCSISLPVTESDWSVVRRSFEMGDVNGKSLKSGQTPLMNAVSCGYEAMVNILLEVGANPNLHDKDGSTALMYAAEHGQERCAKMLMRHETCDPAIKDEEGQTACSIALSNGYNNIAVLIHMQALEKGRLSKHSHSVKRYVWTSNDGSETESVTVKPRSHSVQS